MAILIIPDGIFDLSIQYNAVSIEKFGAVGNQQDFLNCFFCLFKQNPQQKKIVIIHIEHFVPVVVFLREERRIMFFLAGNTHQNGYNRSSSGSTG